jgi:CBS domain containing-hemolysin-like protein
VRTVAGLVFDRLGRRPGPGDAVDVEGVRLSVTGVEGVRITRVVIRLPGGRSEPATPSGEEERHDDGP